MKHVRKAALAASAFTCAALFSLGWSEQGGVSLSIESAQARVGRPLTPVSVAGVARRQNRRAYRYDAAGIAGPMAVNYAGIAAAAGTDTWGWGGDPNNTGTVAPATSAWGSQAYYGAPTANPSGWYLQGGVLACTSGTLVTGGNGLPFRCP
jgi:hypothetical protein